MCDTGPFLISIMRLNYWLAVSGVLEEAEFYNIASLVRLVKDRIRDNENRTSQVCQGNADMMNGKALDWDG